MTIKNNKREKIIFLSNLKNAPKKLSKLFKVEICIPKNIFILSQRSFFEKVLLYEPLIKCILSIDPTNKDRSVVLFKLFIDVTPTSRYKWKSQQVFEFFHCILNDLIQDMGDWKSESLQSTKCYIKVIKPEKQYRAIKWAINDFESCFTAHYENAHFLKKN